MTSGELGGMLGGLVWFGSGIVGYFLGHDRGPRWPWLIGVSALPPFVLAVAIAKRSRTKVAAAFNIGLASFALIFGGAGLALAATGSAGSQAMAAVVFGPVVAWALLGLVWLGSPPSRIRYVLFAIPAAAGLFFGGIFALAPIVVLWPLIGGAVATAATVGTDAAATYAAVRAAGVDLASDAGALTPAGGAPPTEARLEQLERLRASGLLTSAEYDRKRSEIIAGL